MRTMTKMKGYATKVAAAPKMTPSYQTEISRMDDISYRNNRTTKGYEALKLPWHQQYHLRSALRGQTTAQNERMDSEKRPKANL